MSETKDVATIAINIEKLAAAMARIADALERLPNLQELWSPEDEGDLYDPS
jgi:hypothetical protein